MPPGGDVTDNGFSSTKLESQKEVHVRDSEATEQWNAASTW